MAIDIKPIISELKNKIVDLAKTSVKEFADEATTDGKKLVTTMEDDLKRWTQALADGQITRLDFETLVLGQRDLLEMAALKRAGLSLAKIDRFKNEVFSLIIDTVTGLV